MSTPLVEIATLTVFLSVILHGITARPLSRIYGASAIDESADQPGMRVPQEGPVPRSLTTRRSGCD